MMHCLEWKFDNFSKKSNCVPKGPIDNLVSWHWLRVIAWSLTHERPVTRSFDVFFHQRLNKQLSKHSRGWWFQTPLCSLWRHCNGVINTTLANHRWVHLGIYHQVLTSMFAISKVNPLMTTRWEKTWTTSVILCAVTARSGHEYPWLLAQC